MCGVHSHLTFNKTLQLSMSHKQLVKLIDNSFSIILRLRKGKNPISDQARPRASIAIKGKKGALGMATMAGSSKLKTQANGQKIAKVLQDRTLLNSMGYQRRTLDTTLDERGVAHPGRPFVCHRCQDQTTHSDEKVGDEKVHLICHDYATL